MTPYAGQKRALSQALKSIGTTVGGVRVKTTAQMQGHESSIIVVSFVSHRSNEPKKLGFITQRNQLNVELSRARELEILVGNFKGWCQAHEDRNPYLDWRNNQSFKSLIGSLRASRDFISELDWESSFVHGVTLTART